jgi:hypothetical protein
MSISALHSHTTAFYDRNDTLYFMLGLASLALKIRAQLEAERQQPDNAPLAIRLDDGRFDDQYLLFMLGLVAIADQWLHLLEAEGNNRTAARKRPPVTHHFPLPARDLLR